MIPLDISNSIRVNAGENFMISVTPGTDTSKANDPRAKRFKIASVVSQNGATITQENGDEYKATYSINVVKDDKITITYEEQSVYRITINTKDINGEEYINIAHSVAKGWQYLEGQDKLCGLLHQIKSAKCQAMNWIFQLFIQIEDTV